MFLGATLLASGMYSNKVFAFEENGNTHDQNGNLNEAEINADIEQENKCKKDTECENENEINNLLNITTITQTQQQQETSPCEDCFTSILDQGQIDAFLDEFSNQVLQEITTLTQLCEYIDANQGTEALDIALISAADASNSNITFEQYDALIQCLQDAGFNVAIPTV